MTSSTSSSSRTAARAVTLAALLWGAGAHAQSTGVITGTVTDASNGQPVVGAVVIAMSPALPAPETSLTDQEGNFRIPNLPPGPYRLSTQLTGYEPAERSDLVVKAGVTLHANLATTPDAVQLEEMLIRVEKRASLGPPLFPPRRVLVLPPENLAGSGVPLKQLAEIIHIMVASAGIDVIEGAQVDEYLARYRIRYTGGVDRAAARAARDELGADALLVISVELYSTSPPRLALTLRLVAAGSEPEILWIDGYARTGSDSPGIFGIGLIPSFEGLRSDGMAALGRSLAAWLAGKGPAVPPCPGGGWFRPRIAYRARPDRRDLTSIAVLPFVNLTQRRGAGELMALEFTRQFAAAEGFKVTEPGIVREELLRRRIVMEDGVSVDQARTVLNALEGDLVVAGYVFAYDDGLVPGSNFTMLLIDRKTGRIVWESTSYNQGTDSETLFGLNTVSTAPRLTCRMVRETVEGLAGRAVLPSSAR